MPVMPLQERFSQFVEPEPNTGCWLWTGARNYQGYGRFNLVIEGRRTQRQAHRVAWELVNGSIPDGLCCLHRCDNPSCVAIDHLFLGTHQDNQSDKALKKRGRQSMIGLLYGVSVNRSGSKFPFVAQATFKGTRHRIGYFKTAAEANAAASSFRERVHSKQETK